MDLLPAHWIRKQLHTLFPFMSLFIFVCMWFCSLPNNHYQVQYYMFIPTWTTIFIPIHTFVTFNLLDYFIHNYTHVHPFNLDTTNRFKECANVIAIYIYIYIWLLISCWVVSNCGQVLCIIEQIGRTSPIVWLFSMLNLCHLHINAHAINLLLFFVIEIQCCEGKFIALICQL